MNTFHYNAIGFVLGAAMLAPAGLARADDLESRLVDREVRLQEARAGLEATDVIVPPEVPVAPEAVGPIEDGVVQPVYWGRRFYRGPVYRYGAWGPRYYRSYYYPNYYGGYYPGPRYYGYYGGPRYYDYPYGTARIGPLRFYWR
jgi:hypothetical protein